MDILIVGRSANHCRIIKAVLAIEADYKAVHEPLLGARWKRIIVFRPCECSLSKASKLAYEEYVRDLALKLPDGGKVEFV